MRDFHKYTVYRAINVLPEPPNPFNLISSNVNMEKIENTQYIGFLNFFTNSLLEIISQKLSGQRLTLC